MQYTDNYSFRKPGLIEEADIRDINTNMDMIDSKLYENRRISTGDEWSQATSYSEGDLVVYENQLYRCLQNTVGSWDATKWVITHLTDEVIDARSSGGDSANQNIANDFDATQTYEVGDYVIYNELLYKCTTAVTTAGAWDSSKWTSCIVTDEMGSGGGGTTVIANPTGTPTDTLSTVQIGQTIFDIAGGSGGEGYSTTELWTGNETPSTSGMNITLNDGISNYDMIYFIVGNSSYDGADIYFPAELTIGNSYIGTVYSGESIGAYWTYTSDTQIKIMRQASSYAVKYSKIVGIKFGGSGDGEFQPVIYSLSEREIGVWVDGKPLYECVFENTTSISSSSGWVDTGIDIPNGILIYVDAILYQSDGNFTLMWGNIDSSGNLLLNNIRSGSTVTPNYIRVRYTKTTDQPGSGTWTPQGVPAVHYDGDEKIIGTWYGETLYEKTLIISSLSSGYQTVAHGINNIGEHWIHDGYARHPISGGSVATSTVIPYNSSPGAEQFTCNFLETFLEYRAGSELVSHGGSAVLTLRYTKTTS